MLPNWLSYLDLIFAAVVCLFAWRGCQKGFAGQIAHVLTAVFTGVLLFWAYPFLFSYFGRIFRGLGEAYLMWLLLAALALVAIGLYKLFCRLLAAVIQAGMSDRADMGLGLALGAVLGVLVPLLFMIVLVMLDRTGTSFDKMRVKSYVGKAVCNEMVPRVQPRLTSLYENKIREWKNKLLEQEEAGAGIEM